MPRVLVVGSINLDLIVRCPRAPRPGETVHGTEFTMAGGGKGANQAVAAARLGGDTILVGRLGADLFGSQLRQDLAVAGVDISRVASDPEAPTGTAFIVLEETGENRIVVIPGANGRVGHSEVERAAEVMAQGIDVVLMQFEIPSEVVRAVGLRARELGVPCVLDGGGAVREVIEAGILPLARVFSPNETEAERLTGQEVSDLATAREAARRLRSAGAREAVLKLGAAGAYWLGEEGEAHVPGFPIAPVDTTAAGDAFTACLALSLAEGRTMPEAIRRANAAGALACLRVGAQPSMPTRQELEQFLAARTDPGA